MARLLCIRGGLVYANGALLEKDLWIKDGRIAALCEPGAKSLAGPASLDSPASLAEPLSADEPVTYVEAQGAIVSPGFIDIHTHGGFGHDFNTSTPQEILETAAFFAKRGTTAFFTSILTDTQKATEAAIESALEAKARQDRLADPAAGEASGASLTHSGALLAGIHLEGPFLSREYKGAMPEELLRPANLSLLRHYQELSGGMIRYLTVSPEVEGICDAIPLIKDMGIQVAIGHSGADYETARRAIAQGARACTHCMNAMRLWHQHEPAIHGAVLEDDSISLEVIADGRHLHPATVRLLLKIKGPERIIAITDSIMAAGLADGRYHLGVNEVIVQEGDAKLPNGTRAGSTLTMIEALQKLMRFTGRPIEQVLPLLTENPARLTGLSDCMGSLEVGKIANVLLLSPEGELQKVFVRGEEQA